MARSWRARSDSGLFVYVREIRRTATIVRQRPLLCALFAFGKLFARVCSRPFGWVPTRVYLAAAEIRTRPTRSIKAPTAELAETDEQIGRNMQAGVQAR